MSLASYLFSATSILLHRIIALSRSLESSSKCHALLLKITAQIFVFLVSQWLPPIGNGSNSFFNLYNCNDAFTFVAHKAKELHRLKMATVSMAS